MKFILGKKKHMDQIFSAETGKMIPVTVIEAGPCYVTQIKTNATDGYNALQVAFGNRRENLLSRALKNHLKLSPAKRYVKEFRVTDATAENLAVGDKVTVESFVAGDKVAVTGVTKGKGFQGVVKRHNFGGSPASHGHKDQLRMPGSIGSTNAQRVFKGMRMAGRTGGSQVTISYLKIIQVDADRNLLYVSGAVPGSINGLVLLQSKDGNMLVAKKEIKTEAVAKKDSVTNSDHDIVSEQTDNADKETSDTASEANVQEESPAKEAVKSI